MSELESERQALRQEVRRLEMMNEGLITAGQALVAERGELVQALLDVRAAVFSPDVDVLISVQWYKNKLDDVERIVDDALERRRNGEAAQTTERAEGS